MESVEQEVLRLRAENAELLRKLERIGIYARAHIETEIKMLHIYQNEPDNTKEDIRNMIEDSFKKDIVMVLTR